MTPQETDPDLAVSVQESPAETWLGVACCRVGALSTAVLALDLWKEAHDLHHLWSQVQQQGGNSPAHQQKIELKIY